MLSRLPDEILLEVAKLIHTGDDKYYKKRIPLPPNRGWWTSESEPYERDWGHGKWDLLQLSLTDRRTRAIALEPLAVDVTVQLCNVQSLICMFLNYPDLAAKTESLELKWSKLNDDLESPDHAGDAPPHEAFVQACGLVVRNDPTTDLFDKGLWMYELRAGKRNALLAVLFSLLRNIAFLHLQNISLQPLTFFDCLFDPPWAVSYWDQPTDWHCEYLKKVFVPHIAKVQGMELPNRWYTTIRAFDQAGKRLPDQIPVRTFINFSSLRRLVLPERAIFDKPGTKQVDIDPSKYLPSTLESLVILQVDFRNAFKSQDHKVLKFIRRLFDQMYNCRRLDGFPNTPQSYKHSSALGIFPALKQIVIEYIITDAFLDPLVIMHEWNRIAMTQDDLQELGFGMGVSLEFNFPWVGDPFEDD